MSLNDSSRILCEIMRPLSADRKIAHSDIFMSLLSDLWKITPCSVMQRLMIDYLVCQRPIKTLHIFVSTRRAGAILINKCGHADRISNNLFNFPQRFFKLKVQNDQECSGILNKSICLIHARMRLKLHSSNDIYSHVYCAALYFEIKKNYGLQ